jgi:6-phosphogluconolactonase
MTRAIAMSTPREIRIMENGDELAREAADLYVWLGSESIRTRGRFLVALSGGSTPKRLHQMLADSTYARRLDWTKVQFFFGDERCVPPTHPDSNFGMAKATLFDPLRVQPSQIYRVKGEDQPAAAATDYESLIRKVTRNSAPVVPELDLILLGMGADGHTASLFPGTAAARERTRLVAEGTAPTGVPHRVTMTLPLINQAHVVLFLVTGQEKASTVRQVLENKDGAGSSLPASMVEPETGRLIWFLDHGAASELTLRKQAISSCEE